MPRCTCRDQNHNARAAAGIEYNVITINFNFIHVETAADVTTIMNTSEGQDYCALAVIDTEISVPGATVGA
jgi:hypothetical protein